MRFGTSHLLLTAIFFLFSVVNASHVGACKRPCEEYEEKETGIRKKEAPSLKTEPGCQAPKQLILLTPDEIQKNFIQFKNINNAHCLSRSVAFINWVKIRSLNHTQSPLDENIQFFPNGAVHLIDVIQAQKLPIVSHIYEIEDNSNQLYLGIDVTDILLTPLKLNELGDWLSSLPLIPLNKGSYQVGFMYLDYLAENRVDDEIKGHYLNFYIYAPQDQSSESFIVDVSQDRMWPLDDFIREAPQYYEDKVFVWRLDVNKDKLLVKPKIKKENGKDEIASIENAAQVAGTSSIERVASSIEEGKLKQPINYVSHGKVDLSHDRVTQYYFQLRNSQGLTQIKKEKTALGPHQLHHSDRRGLLTENMIEERFRKAVNSQHLTQGQKELAGLGFAYMRYTDDTSDISDNVAVHYLQQAFYSQYLTPEHKDLAALTLASMRYEKRTDRITDDQAVQWFQQAFYSQYLTPKEKGKAALDLAWMRYNNRTNQITDDKAAEYFYSSCGSSYIFQRDKDNASLGLAWMCVLNMTTLISNDQAAQYFQRALGCEDLPKLQKHDAAIGLALMRYDNRTQCISANDAIGILRMVISETSDLDFLRNASYLLHKFTSSGLENPNF